MSRLVLYGLFGLGEATKSILIPKVMHNIHGKEKMKDIHGNEVTVSEFVQNVLNS